jgi:ERCC4-type nuclease
VVILIDSREQNQEYIESKLKDSGIQCTVSCLAHGMDYLIVGTTGSIGVQRKTFPEVATQMPEIREDIIPSLMDLTERPVLLIEEIFRIDEQGMMWRKEGSFLKPAQISARQYYNFLQSIRQMGCEVVTTRDLDQSIWWMYSVHSYVHEMHYPKQKKRYGSDMQAMGALCCFNGIGQTTAKKILQKHSLKDLVGMTDPELIKAMTLRQGQNFRKVIEARINVQQPDAG